MTALPGHGSHGGRVDSLSLVAERSGILLAVRFYRVA